MKKKILITGACGFIGSHLTEFLVKKGFKVIAFDRYNSFNNWGNLENSKYKNDFGSENEVFCFNHCTLNKSQNLYMENEGRVTADIPTKFLESQNIFFV